MTTMVGAWIDRDVLRCVGGDAASFLQGQLSQDVVALDVGRSRWSLLLAPQGRLDAVVRVSRVAPDEFVLDLPAGAADAAMARLNRFKLRVDCTIERVDGWRCLAVRVPSEGVDRPGTPGVLESLDTASAVVVADPAWPGCRGLDLLGPDVAIPDGLTLDAGAVEQLRLRAGVPEFGAELDDATIPAEGGPWLIEQSVSFTKGCYVGQELVARVDSRGSNTPRRLRRLILDAAAPAGVDVTDAEGRDVGAVTSSRGLDALAMLKRSVEVGDRVRAGGVSAEVVDVGSGDR